MGQEEVLKILRRKKQATLKDLAQELNLHFVSIWRILVRLAKEGIVERKVVELKEAEKFNFSRRGRNHIVWRLKGGEGK